MATPPHESGAVERECILRLISWYAKDNRSTGNPRCIAKAKALEIVMADIAAGEHIEAHLEERAAE